MNKKILSLALIFAAFFLGCSADGSIPSSVAPPEWDKISHPTPEKYCETESGRTGECER
ncbi:MAG: hypothetical protein LBQ87_07940 [Candidatus Fibromonas sp.]|jgi:hypothetical protein|nr:hypothetical protein [Candidatus Fibromonas sp.]